MAQASYSRTYHIATMPSDFVVCRVMVGNHTPSAYPQVYRTTGGGYEETFTCQFCGTEISKFRDRHGFRISTRRYKYPPDYLMEEGGTMTASEKAGLFVREAGLTGASKTTKISKKRVS